MKVSTAGRKAIAGHEGVRLKAYPDPATGGEPWTIGVGHTSVAGPPKVYQGLTITAAECDEILSRDLATFEAAVSKAVTAPLNQNQFDALVSLAFNIGAGAFARSTLVKKLNDRDYRGAADQFTVWNKAGGRVKNGLVKRRADERALFLRAYADPLAPLPKPTESLTSTTIAAPAPGLWARILSALGFNA